MTQILQPFRVRPSQDANIVSARTALVELKAIWAARLKVMHENIAHATSALDWLSEHGRDGVDQAAFEALIQPLKEINSALRSQHDVQDQYLADLRVSVNTCTP